MNNGSKLIATAFARNKRDGDNQWTNNRRGGCHNKGEEEEDDDSDDDNMTTTMKMLKRQRNWFACIDQQCHTYYY